LSARISFPHSSARTGRGTEVDVPVPNGLPIVLLCAASGTGLTDIASALRISDLRTAVTNGDPLVKDLESLVCTWYSEPPEQGLPASDLPKMETVAKRPRRELYESWRLACAQILNDIVDQNRSDPAVLSMHLTWYNPDTSEFFSPIDVSELARGDCSVVHVVILIDDIYDMYYRLRGDGNLYADVFMKHHRRMLKKLTKHVEEDGLTEKLEEGLQSQVIELALGDLLMWRRSEMIQAENIAQTLRTKLTVLGTKHDERALRTIVQNPDAPRIYLSHRITEHRRYNMDTCTEDNPLGDWMPAVEEVNRLHQEFLRVGQVLVNPTAIDELRFDPADYRGRRDPRLKKRWPTPEPENDLLWSRSQPDRGPEHTTILTGDKLVDLGDEDVSRSIATSLANRIYFEIAFRDHVIVENTPNLCVYRPFFCVDMDKAETSAEWSSGVKREVKHWKETHRNRVEGLPNATDRIDTTLRRIALVHTTDEIRCRIRWLFAHDNEEVFLGNARRHLEGNWSGLGMPNAEIHKLLAGKLPEADASQLSRSPEDPVVQEKPKQVLAQIWPAVQIALHLEFSSLNRPGTEDDAEDVSIGLEQVAFFAITETGSRNAQDLDVLVRNLSRFFGNDLDEEAVISNNKEFWRICDECCQAEKGMAFEQHVAQKLGLDYEGLQGLANQAS